MSTEIQDRTEEMGPTKPLKEHEWLQKLVGEWSVDSEMMMGPDKVETAKGTESVVSMGGLWAFGTGKTQMPGGDAMEYHTALGYDVSFKHYAGCWFASVSSHLWKYKGELRADGKKLTLNCQGPDMVNEGKTANYRDVIEIVDDNHRTLTSYGEQENGEWQQFMKATYTRV